MAKWTGIPKFITNLVRGRLGIGGCHGPLLHCFSAVWLSHTRRPLIRESFRVAHHSQLTFCLQPVINRAPARVSLALPDAVCENRHLIICDVGSCSIPTLTPVLIIRLLCGLVCIY